MSFWTTFLLTNLHFAGELFVSLTSLIAAYVLFGVWRSRRQPKILLRMLGFLAFVVFSGWHSAGDVSGFANTAQLALKFLAFLLLGVSLFADPVQVVPPRVVPSGEEKPPPLPPLPLILSLGAAVLDPLLRALNLFILGALSARLWVKYARGLEKELGNLVKGFGLLFVSEAIFSLALFRDSAYILLSSLGADFGPVWIASHILKFLGFVFIALWAWGYLRFKLFSQVFGAFVATSLFIFVAVTFVYTSLLVNRMQKSALENLRISMQIFKYAVERQEGQALAVASLLSTSQNFKDAVKSSDTAALALLAQEKMVSSGVDFLAVTDKSGVVLARGEDPEAVGDSLAGNFVVTEALKGEGETNISVKEWIGAPQVLLEASVPLGPSADGLGAVYTGYILDNAFVDGVREATGLEVTIFGGKVRAATTLIGPDGVSRLTGVEVSEERVKEKVLEKGALFLGLASVSQREYLSAYGPLHDKKGEILGMLFVGHPSHQLFEAAQDSLATTFLATALLALLSFLPAWLLARFIEEHQV